MRVAGESENYGVEQEHLNQVFGARLRITALRSDHGPGIEFLEYIAPPGGRPVPPDSQANDLIFWKTELQVDHLADLGMKLKETGARYVSKAVVATSGHTVGAGKILIVRDPDGHALQLSEACSGCCRIVPQTRSATGMLPSPARRRSTDAPAARARLRAHVPAAGRAAPRASRSPCWEVVQYIAAKYGARVAVAEAPPARRSCKRWWPKSTRPLREIGLPSPRR
jgi:hypothetical protein